MLIRIAQFFARAIWEEYLREIKEEIDDLQKDLREVLDRQTQNNNYTWNTLREMNDRIIKVERMVEGGQLKDAN